MILSTRKPLRVKTWPFASTLAEGDPNPAMLQERKATALNDARGSLWL